MSALFVALSIMVLALLTLLLWFVPHLLQQQATRVAGETTQLREMLLDLLNEQEAVTVRQTQLGSSLTRLQHQLEQISQPTALQVGQPVASINIQQLEARLNDVQSQLQSLAQMGMSAQRTQQDNESWAYLLSLLASIQERVGEISRDRVQQSTQIAGRALLEELEEEMHNLRNISEDITALQWRLRRSLDARETNMSLLRTKATNGVS